MSVREGILRGALGEAGVQDPYPTLRKVEETYVLQTFRYAGADMAKAAKLAGITLGSFGDMIKRLELEEELEKIRQGCVGGTEGAGYEEGTTRGW